MFSIFDQPKHEEISHDICNKIVCRKKFESQSNQKQGLMGRLRLKLFYQAMGQVFGFHFCYLLCLVSPVDSRFTVMLWNIEPTMGCEIGSPITQETIDASIEYSLMQGFLTQAGYINETDFDYLCVQEVPEELKETEFLLNLGLPFYVLNYQAGSVLTQLSYGVAQRVDENPKKIFENIDPLVIFLIVFTPLGLGFFCFAEEDMSFFYHISNFFGYIFFQPEVLFKIPFHRFLICLSLQLLNLVFFSLYFWYLERFTENIKTMGGMHPEDDYYRQKLYVDPNILVQLMSEYFIPVPIDYNGTAGEFFEDSFILEHFEDKSITPFFGISIMVLKLDLFFCDFKIVELPYKLSEFHLFYSRYLDPTVPRKINPFVVDNQMYYNYALEENFYDLYPDLEACPTRGYFSHFQLGLSELSLLWAIFLCGLLIGLAWFLIELLVKSIKKKYGLISFYGPRSLFNEEITDHFYNATLLHCGLSFCLFRHLYCPMILSNLKIKAKKTRSFFRKEKIKEIRRAVIRSTVKQIVLKKVFPLFKGILKTKKAKKSWTIDRIVRNLKTQTKNSRVHDQKGLGFFISETIKEIFAMGLENAMILRTPYKNRLPFVQKGNSFNIKSVNAIYFSLFFLILKEHETDN